MSLVISIASIGFIVCLYAWYVDWQIAKDPSYKAVCDINDAVNCTKTLKSPYGKLIGISNTILGIIFYLSMIIFSYLGYHALVCIGAFISIIFSLYLAYILFFKIKTVCLICITIYAINIALVITSCLNVS